MEGWKTEKKAERKNRLTKIGIELLGRADSESECRTRIIGQLGIT